MRVAVLDDWQAVARDSADWSALAARAELTFFTEPLGDESGTAAALAEFDVIVAMRERTAFPASLIDRLPRLKQIAVTGLRTWTLDLDACTRRGIVVCHTGATRSTAATAELALALMLAAARHLAQADRAVRGGGFQSGIAAGTILEGRSLGLIGLGKIGGRMAR